MSDIATWVSRHEPQLDLIASALAVDPLLVRVTATLALAGMDADEAIVEHLTERLAAGGDRTELARRLAVTLLAVRGVDGRSRR